MPSEAFILIVCSAYVLAHVAAVGDFHRKKFFSRFLLFEWLIIIIIIIIIIIMIIILGRVNVPLGSGKVLQDGSPPFRVAIIAAVSRNCNYTYAFHMFHIPNVYTGSVEVICLCGEELGEIYVNSLEKTHLFIRTCDSNAWMSFSNCITIHYISIRVYIDHIRYGKGWAEALNIYRHGL